MTYSSNDGLKFLFQFRTDIARTEYLSNADERLRWQANSLPADDLCTENAIMLKRFNRLVPVSVKEPEIKFSFINIKGCVKMSRVKSGSIFTI